RDLTQWENHYFLERSGYDCITPNLELRIPEGRYNVNWRYSKVSVTPSGEFKKLVKTKQIGNTKPLLNLNNKYISAQRAIMLHQGNTSKDTEGCLLFGDTMQLNKSNIPTGIQGKCSSPMAQKLLNFLIQDETIKNTFLNTTKDDGIGLKIPNITFIIRNNFGRIAKSERVVARDKYQIQILEKVSKFDNIDDIKKSTYITYFKIKANNPSSIKKIVESKEVINAIVAGKRKLDSITLHNYPQPSNEFIYTLSHDEHSKDYEKDKAILLIAYDNSQTLNKYNFIQLGFEAIDVAHFIVDEM
ncbi:hypothetical protein CQA53_11640, partial [Helicobacter didelphidarum]